MDRIPAFALIACLLLAALAWIATWSPEETLAADPRIEQLATEIATLRAERNMLIERLGQLETAVQAAAEMVPAVAAVEDRLPLSEVPTNEEGLEEPVSVPASVQRIQEAGLTDQEFASMQQRAQALYLENFQEEWLQRREAFLAGAQAQDSRDQLRSELGDDAYDRYLYASGRPNRVRVRRVMVGSAAAQAGIAEGDVLLSYDGERLFGFDDLRTASYQGEPGDTVLLEVRRDDGTVSQMIVTRGPMGISGYGGWRETPGS